MPHRAHGTFDVKLSPLSPDAVEPALARLGVEKTFHGDLDGTSAGVMIASGGPDEGAGGYVAMERVTGTLHGRRGSFVLQHSGTMSGGAFAIDVEVVPGSGKGALAGLAGKMTIHIAGKDHSYDLEYSLP